MMMKSVFCGRLGERLPDQRIEIRRKDDEGEKVESG